MTLSILALLPLTAILLGVINICIVAAVLLLVGYVIVWIVGIIGFSIPDVVQKLYLAIVLLIVLYLFVRLLLGVPAVTFIG